MMRSNDKEFEKRLDDAVRQFELHGVAIREIEGGLSSLRTVMAGMWMERQGLLETACENPCDDPSTCVGCEARMLDEGWDPVQDRIDEAADQACDAARGK